MPLRLTIENMTSLPDGGPLSYTLAGKRGIDIGRDQYLDWVLPDPNRVVSGKHCEIRWQDGSYWLRDISTNGTFLNQSPNRMMEPHRLTDGDRIEIGHYIINVALDGEEASSPAAADPAAGADLWKARTVAPPVEPGELRAPHRPDPVLAADPLDWLAQMPAPQPVPPMAADDLWDVGAAPAPGGSSPRRSTLPPPEHAAAAPPPRPAVDAPLPPAPPPSTPMPPAVAPAIDPASSADSGAEFIRRFAEGAGLDPGVITIGDAGELAETLGMLMHLCAGNLAQLLAARARSKSAMRSANQTLIQLQGNNPLRFAPTPQDAMAIMFGHPTPSYLEATEAFEQAFQTLKKHQLDTYAAVQEALQLLLADFDPAAIEQSTESPKGALFGGERSHKARLWDEFAMRWKTRSAAFDGGMYGAFMRFFVEAYDRKGE